MVEDSEEIIYITFISTNHNMPAMFIINILKILVSL